MSALKTSCIVLRIFEFFTTLMVLFAAIEGENFWIAVWISNRVPIDTMSYVRLILSGVFFAYTVFPMGWSTCFSAVGLLSLYGAIFDAFAAAAYIALAFLNREFLGTSCSNLADTKDAARSMASKYLGQGFSNVDVLCGGEQVGFTFSIISCILFIATVVVQILIWKRRNTTTMYKPFSDIEMPNGNKLSTPYANEKTSYGRQ